MVFVVLRCSWEEAHIKRIILVVSSMKFCIHQIATFKGFDIRASSVLANCYGIIAVT